MRKTIATLLVRVASKIYPQSEEVKQFRLKMMTDAAISGGAIYRIDPQQFVAPTKTDKQ